MKQRLQHNRSRLGAPAVASLAVALCLLVPVEAFAQDSSVVAGFTEPILDVTVSASVPGTVTKIQVKEGDFVEENQLVMELEKRQEELEVERRKLIWESKAELTAAAAQMELLKVDLEGTRKLLETTKSVSQEEYRKKELEYKQAVAEHDKLVLAEAREELEHRMAIEMLRKREIRSPLAGFVADRLLEVGEDCEAQQPLLRIVDTRRCYFICSVEARAGASLKAGQPAKLEVEVGQARQPCEGVITYVSPVVDPASGLLKIKVLFDNPDAKVRPGVAGLIHLPKAQP